MKYGFLLVQSKLSTLLSVMLAHLSCT